MTHKKKQLFTAPAIRVVRMHSERSIMAASETPGNVSTEGLTPPVSINWGTNTLSN